MIKKERPLSYYIWAERFDLQILKVKIYIPQKEIFFLKEQLLLSVKPSRKKHTQETKKIHFNENENLFFFSRVLLIFLNHSKRLKLCCLYVLTIHSLYQIYIGIFYYILLVYCYIQFHSLLMFSCKRLTGFWVLVKANFTKQLYTQKDWKFELRVLAERSKTMKNKKRNRLSEEKTCDEGWRREETTHDWTDLISNVFCSFLKVESHKVKNRISYLTFFVNNRHF